MTSNQATPESIAAAKAACLAERQALRDLGIHVEPDEIELGMRLGNAIAAAVFGVRGELRKKSLKRLLPADEEE